MGPCFPFVLRRAHPVPLSLWRMGTVEAMAPYLQAFSELLPPTQQVRNPAFQEATPPPNGKSAQGTKARPPSLQAACEPRHKGSRLSRGSFQSLNSPLPTPQGFIFTSRDTANRDSRKAFQVLFFCVCFFLGPTFTGFSS